MFVIKLPTICIPAALQCMFHVSTTWAQGRDVFARCPMSSTVIVPTATLTWMRNGRAFSLHGDFFGSCGATRTATRVCLAMMLAAHDFACSCSWTSLETSRSLSCICGSSVVWLSKTCGVCLMLSVITKWSLAEGMLSLSKAGARATAFVSDVSNSALRSQVTSEKAYAVLAHSSAAVCICTCVASPLRAV